MAKQHSGHAGDAKSHGHGTHHAVPLQHYWAVFAVLMVGLVLTVAAAAVDLGRVAVVVAVGIAAFKATAIVLIFMHVKYSSRLVQLLAIGGYLWLMILFLFAGMDYITRTSPLGLAP